MRRPVGTARLAGHLLQEQVLPVLTALGRCRGGGFGQDTDATDLLVLMWAEEVAKTVCPDLVGVWWDETLAPERLSAPRGAVFDGSIAGFAVTPVPWSSVPADETLLSRKKAKRVSVDRPTHQAAIGMR